MAISLIITVNLLGSVGAPVKHTHMQEVKVNISSENNKKPFYITKKIKHTDRKRTNCCKKVKIEDSVLKFWENSDCPKWEKPSNWKKYNKQKKVESYIKSFDEGYGVTYTII